MNFLQLNKAGIERLKWIELPDRTISLIYVRSTYYDCLTVGCPCR